MADAADEPAVGAVSQLVPATLKAMHALEFAGRHLSPTALPQLIEAMAGRDDDAKAALALSRALDWPERLKPVRACLEPAAEAAAPGIARRRSAGGAPPPIPGRARRRSPSSPPTVQCAITPRLPRRSSPWRRS